MYNHNAMKSFLIFVFFYSNIAFILLISLVGLSCIFLKHKSCRSKKIEAIIEIVCDDK